MKGEFVARIGCQITDRKHPESPECLTLKLTRRRSATRGGNPPAQRVGGRVERDVRRGAKERLQTHDVRNLPVSHAFVGNNASNPNDVRAGICMVSL